MAARRASLKVPAVAPDLWQVREGWTVPQMDDTQIHESRRRRREFIRTNHPDRGGDPEVFIAGLCAFPERGPDCGPLPTVVIVRRRAWLTRMVMTAGQRLRRGSESPRVR
jgi:hypothetical protein